MFRFFRYCPGIVSILTNDLKKSFGGFCNSSLVLKISINKSALRPVYFLQARCIKSISLCASSKESLNELKSSRRDHERTMIIKTISKVLSCCEEDLYHLYLNHNDLAELRLSDFINRIDKLQLYEIQMSSIKENLWVLSFNLNQLTSRLELLKKWKFSNLNNGLGLLKLPLTRFKKYTFQTEKHFVTLGNRNRITYFSDFVKSSEKEACDLFLKYPFMLRINVEYFKEILSMAIDMGVLKEDLLSDPWLFIYKPQSIANRIQLLDEIDAKEKCKVIKPWMLRCTQTTLNRYFELKEENIAALGSYTNLQDLLSNELELSDAEVEEMFAKHPPLAKISYSKAKEMIDFLKTEGFNSKMIYQVPRVLCHKQATLMGRMLELKKLNPRMMSLQNLCRNKKDYLAFLIKVQGSHS